MHCYVGVPESTTDVATDVATDATTDVATNVATDVATDVAHDATTDVLTIAEDLVAHKVDLLAVYIAVPLSLLLVVGFFIPCLYFIIRSKRKKKLLPREACYFYEGNKIDCV